jgi:hypothetical protein
MLAQKKTGSLSGSRSFEVRDCLDEPEQNLVVLIHRELEIGLLWLEPCKEVIIFDVDYYDFAFNQHILDSAEELAGPITIFAVIQIPKITLDTFTIDYLNQLPKLFEFVVFHN